MNKYLRLLSLTVLPLLLFYVGYILKEAQGPYYLKNYDHAYAYIFNFLNLAQLTGKGAGQFDHPGIPVHFIGAVVTKLYYFINYRNEDIVLSVLLNPEVYLDVVQKVFVLINCAGLFFLGLLTYNLSKNLYLSIFIQLSPFASTQLFYGLSNVSPENFMIFICICLIGFLIYYMFKIDIDQRTPVRVIIVVAFILGLGLSTKLNFFPLMIIPFILIKGLKQKALLFILTFIIFFLSLLFIHPGMLPYKHVANLIVNIVLRNRGTEPAAIINVSSFTSNILSVLTKDILFTVSYFFISIIFLLSIGFRKLKMSCYNNKDLRKQKKIIFATFLALSVQIAAVGKLYNQYYMLPSFMLIVFTIMISIYFLYYLTNHRFNLNLIYTAAFVLIFSFVVKDIYSLYKTAVFQREESFRIMNFISENYSNEIIIPAYFSASPECALAVSSNFAGKLGNTYKAILSKMLKTKIYYTPWNNKIQTLDKSLDIKELLGSKKRIFFQVYLFDSINELVNLLRTSYGIKVSGYKKIFQNGNHESVYEIELK